MRALVFDGELRVVEDYPDPQPAPGEAVIRVTRAGICNTDLEIVKGYMGFRGAPGHEFVGVVEQAEDERWVGRRVVGDINCACGRCEACAEGQPHHCPHRTVLGILGRDGAFAERLRLPTRNLFEVPPEVSDDEAVFVEPLAAAYEILEQTRLGPGQRAAVLGDGKLGLLAAQALHDAGAEVTAIGRHESKLRILAERGIATRLADDPPPERFDCVVECTGSPAGLETAMSLTRPRGVIVLKSTTAGGKALNLAPIVIDEITVIGSRCGPFAPAIRALAEGRVEVRAMISARYPLSEGVAAFEHARRKGVLKVLVDAAPAS